MAETPMEMVFVKGTILSCCIYAHLTGGDE